ncbi:MAG TPA: hypothetical protein VIH89_08910 [Candidatus Sulfotelmatobacter sp.]
MHISVCGRLLLVSVVAAASLSVLAQGQSGYLNSSSLDVAVTYAGERAQIAPGTCGCFWLQGGGADAALTFWKGIGASASITGAHAHNYYSGIDVNKIAYMFGPRYTFAGWNLGTKERSLQIFGEALFGGVHAFNGAFPTSTGLTASANSFAMQAGGGVNLVLSRKIGLRLLQADYMRTDLPNSYSKSQNDLRLAAGVNYRFGSAHSGY